MTPRRRHHNTTGARQVWSGSTRRPMRQLACRLGVPSFATAPAIHEQWATISPPDEHSEGRWQLCLWGDQGSAMEGRDGDERVCRVRVEVLEVLA